AGRAAPRRFAICSRKVRVFLWQERDAAKLPRIVGDDLPDLHVIRPPRDVKDLSDLHLRAADKTPQIVETLKDGALTLTAWRQRAEAAAEKLRRQQNGAKAKEQAVLARPVLEAPDPLRLILQELRRQRYGGDPRVPVFVYLAATSRLLALDKASMPVHLL